MPLAVVPISLGSVILAAAAMATLVALHHLRAQPIRRPVATLIFWRAAARPQQARVAWSRRFTRPKTFALLAAIALLTAAALTADRWGRVGPADHRDVIVVDAGIDMAADDGSGRPLLRRAADAARADLGATSAAPALIAAGEQPILLSRGDEPVAVVRRRLDLLVPGAGASAAGLALQLAGSVQGWADGEIRWYTAQDQLPAGLPGDVARRVRVHHLPALPAVAIVGLAFEPGVEDPSRGTLTVTCGGRPTGPMTVVAQLDGDAALTRPVPADAGRATVAFANLPADGRSVAIRLTAAPGPAATHEARLRLPDRRPLTFRFVGDVPPPLRAAALALGTEADAGRIVVVAAGASVPTDATAAVAVVDRGKPVAADEQLSFAPGTPWGRGLSLEGSSARGPALAVPGVPVLTAGRATLATLDETPAHRTLYLSGGLVAPAADLPRRAAYPVLLERLCRELVGRPSPSPIVSALRGAQDPLWPGPPDEPAGPAPVALPDAPPMVLAVGSVNVATAETRHVPWAEVVLGLALALAIVETLLLAARRIV